MLLAHDRISKPSNPPSLLPDLRVTALPPAEASVCSLWQEPTQLPKIMHLTSRWLKSGEINPTPPWHVPEERADPPQSMSKELHFGGFLTEVPLLHKISEGFCCLFIYVSPPTILKRRDDAELGPIAVS